jgi:NAD(P)-dependent dehydrogenase (short-subunit alcohol dehydrogenase family)
MAGSTVSAARFAGRLALITGAASGIGATAFRLAAEGAAVAATTATQSTRRCHRKGGLERGATPATHR